MPRLCVLGEREGVHRSPLATFIYYLRIKKVTKKIPRNRHPTRRVPHRAYSMPVFETDRHTTAPMETPIVSPKRTNIRIPQPKGMPFTIFIRNHLLPQGNREYKNTPLA